MKKWYTEFGAAIEMNHNVIQRNLGLHKAEGALEELFFRRTNVRAEFAGSALLYGHDFLLAVAILANWLREYRCDQGRTKSEVESSAR